MGDQFYSPCERIVMLHTNGSHEKEGQILSKTHTMVLWKNKNAVSTYLSHIP